MKQKATQYLIGLAILWLAGICLAFNAKESNDFESAKLEIVLRKVGHEILLLAGDRTSRVLPVKQINDNEYQLTFQNDFTFQPDSLVKAINTVLAANHIADDYIVNVLNCNNQKRIFGYAVLRSQKNDIVPCSGRIQPKNCYRVNIKFDEKVISDTQKGYLMGGLPLLFIVGFLTFKSSKNGKRKLEAAPSSTFKIGQTLFDPEKRQLKIFDTVTELTQKENDLLLIFAQSPNTMIERSLLQKQIWEDEGVIVGRSLDMFISKLRKKLEADPSIQLSNIHGKGYKLLS